VEDLFEPDEERVPVDRSQRGRHLRSEPVPELVMRPPALLAA
jgi:hypothetical protein